MTEIDRILDDVRAWIDRVGIAAAADASGVHRNIVSRVLRGHGPTTATLRKLETAMRGDASTP